MKVSWPSEEKAGGRRERVKIQKRDNKAAFGGGFIFSE